MTRLWILTGEQGMSFENVEWKCWNGNLSLRGLVVHHPLKPWSWNWITNPLEMVTTKHATGREKIQSLKGAFHWLITKSSAFQFLAANNDRKPFFVGECHLITQVLWWNAGSPCRFHVWARYANGLCDQVASEILGFSNRPSPETQVIYCRSWWYEAP